MYTCGEKKLFRTRFKLILWTWRWRIAKGIHFRFSVHLPIGQKKSKLIGYVVACGLQYGLGENLFHFFFKVSVRVIERNWRVWPTFWLMWNEFIFKQVSWLMQFPRVPLFGEGTNFVPMIHVHDLAGWLLALACYSYSLNCTRIAAGLNCVPFPHAGWFKK